MTAAVYFQALPKKDRIEGIAHLLLRRNRLTPKLVVLCPDSLFIQHLSFQLWTIEATSFLAHGIATDDGNANANHPILLTEQLNHPHQATVLVNGGLEIPPVLDGFDHIVDFVDAWDDALKQAARQRFRSYRQIGYAPKYLG
ncbi:MAG: DNA polymerase III subunit chi [Mariprofundaceae bacterium]|nr:DNA polymerase III subunit chi [Mariprofundaceae bacterium]